MLSVAPILVYIPSKMGKIAFLQGIKLPIYAIKQQRAMDRIVEDFPIINTTKRFRLHPTNLLYAINKLKF